MTIRKELEQLGPDAVRAGMVAFEHPGHQCPNALAACCFLTHALGVGGYNAYVRANGTDNRSGIEVNFENWMTRPKYAGGPKALRQECIAYLAEHGTAVEIAPKKSARALRIAAMLCLLLLVLV